MSSSRSVGDDASGLFAGRRIGLAGPMLGGNAGWVTSQHELLAERLAAEGAEVRTTSTKPQRLLRLADTLRSVNTWSGRVDVVVIAVFSGPGFWIADATSLVAQRRGIPQILVLHGGGLPGYVRSHSARAQACLRRAAAVVAPSPYLAAEVPSPRAIAVIPNVFDLGAIEFQPRQVIRPRLLWMRTFHPIYNPLLALDVLTRVRTRHPEATLTMAGQEKGMLAACKERAAVLGLGDAVEFPGFLGEEQKRQAFADHDVFLNTNDVDNSPVSVLEAAAAGLSVVATAVGGIPYLFTDGTSGLLAPAGDAAGLADAVLSVVEDPGRAGALARAGRVVAEQSAWPNVRRLWQRQFETIAGA